MQFKNIYIILFATFFLSCENNETNIDANNLLIGNWVEPIYNEDTTSFKRSNTLPNEAYGISFKQDGNFIERTSGWCGTPPLTYFNVDGNFETDRTLVKITTNAYPSFYQWRIIELTENKLVVKRELSEQEIEHNALMVLFNEIENLVYSETCSNFSNWSFVAYGSKACGGPKGYIPYSKNIDTVSFLQKVETYSKAEKEFNVKWSIASDCAIASPPKYVECKNGYPVLIY